MGAVALDLGYRVISKGKTFSKLFSICCMVTDLDLYADLRKALDEKHFSEVDCEFLVADNSKGAQLSAYEALRIFLRESVGKYVLILHQDAFPKQTCEELIRRIQQVEEADSAWGIIGNAGKESDSSAHGALSLETWQGMHRLEKPFVKVEVIDENVIIVKNGLGITVSGDLEGFHFYGFDISSVAKRLGYHSYVVDFMWVHYSPGNIDERFIAAKEAVEKKMSGYHPRRRAATTCTFLYWGSNYFTWLWTMCRSIYYLEISPSHKRGANLLRHACYKKHTTFRWIWPVFYYIVFKGFCHIWQSALYVWWWVRFPFIVPLKICSWHFHWWKKNWRSRLNFHSGESEHQD